MATPEQTINECDTYHIQSYLRKYITTRTARGEPIGEPKGYENEEKEPVVEPVVEPVEEWYDKHKGEVFKQLMGSLHPTIGVMLSSPKPCMFTINAAFTCHEDDEYDTLHEMDITSCVDVVFPIIRIKSNYGEWVHPDYPPPPPKKKKKRRRRRCVQGNGSSFNSQATVTILYNNRKYGVKVFRKNKLVAPNCIEVDNSDAIAVFQHIMDTFNDVWPDRDYHMLWETVDAPMHNFKFQLLDSEYIIDLERLSSLLQLTWEDDGMANPPDFEQTGKFPGLIARFRSRRQDKLVAVCIQKSGRITINGSAGVGQHESIWQWCNLVFYKYKDYLLHKQIKLPPIVLTDPDNTSDSDNSDA
jgi:hypothetical protein